MSRSLLVLPDATAKPLLDAIGGAKTSLRIKIGQAVDAYLASAKQDTKPLKETLKKVYGDNETIKSLNDSFDEAADLLWAREADVVESLNRMAASPSVVGPPVMMHILGF